MVSTLLEILATTTRTPYTSSSTTAPVSTLLEILAGKWEDDTDSRTT